MTVFANSITTKAMPMQGEAVALDEAEETEQMKLKITAGGQEFVADLEDNATTRALWDMLTLTVPMMDLYGREMCYRFTEALPTENFRSDAYEVGDLVYWAPGHSLVILYKQNGEQFSRQQLGHIQSGVEIFDGMGDVNVTFEKYTEQEPGETVPPESGTEETENTEVNRPNPGNQQTVPGKGTILTDDKKQMHYKVTKAGFSGGTVEYLKSTNRKATSITIPGTVSINGITYKVTGIAARAFKDNKSLCKLLQIKEYPYKNGKTYEKKYRKPCIQRNPCKSGHQGSREKTEIL